MAEPPPEPRAAAPSHQQAGHRRDQRRRHHRWLRARAQLRLPVASDRARFADTHARIGIQPGWGLTVLLAEAVGVRRARELSATGNFLDAATALTWGLVNHVVPHEELLPFCRQLAADIASNDPAGVSQILATYHEGSMSDRRGGVGDRGAQASREWMASGPRFRGGGGEAPRGRDGPRPRPGPLTEQRVLASTTAHLRGG